MKYFYNIIVVLSLLCYVESSTIHDANQPDANKIPLWHFRMIHDEVRNEAYYSALRSVIVPSQSVVLDLGSGTGLLSLFAASLGAKKITAVEQSSSLCDLSRDILAVNNISKGLIDIINVHSNHLRLGFDGFYQQKADVLVSETLDSWIIGEGFLDSLLDLRTRNLIKKTAVIIPNRATVFIQLLQTNFLFKTEDPYLMLFNFEPVRKHKYHDGIVESLAAHGGIALSDVHPMLNFDFQNYGLDGHLPVPYASLHIPIQHDGILHGAGLWFEACLDDACHHILSNAPNASLHWNQMIRIFASSEKKVTVGMTINLLVAQISQRYIFAVANYHERIMKVESACDHEIMIYRVEQHDGDEHQSDAFPLPHYGNFNLWHAMVGDVYRAVVYYNEATACQRRNDHDDGDDDAEHDGACVWEEELWRVVIGEYPAGYDSVKDATIPLYDYLLTC